MESSRGKRTPLFSVLLFVLLDFFAQPSEAADHLLGSWQCRSGTQALSLEFQSENLLIFQGEPAGYVLMPGAIRVQQGSGVVDYPYTLQGKALSIRFPDGQVITCARVVSAKEKTEDLTDAPAPLTQEPKEIPEGEAGDPSWGFSFSPPKGWKFRKDPNNVLLGHDIIAGMIVVFPHQVSGMQALAQQMQEGLVEQGVFLKLSSQLSQKGNSLLSGEYTGTVQGQKARGHGIGTLSPHGGGAYILAVTTPERFGKEIAEAAIAIAESMRYFKVDVSHLMRIFVGRWASYSGISGGGTLTNYTFYPDGSFLEEGETSYSSEYSSSGWTMPDSYAAAVGTDSRRARWTVRGSERQGQIIITSPGGAEGVIDYQVYVEKGQTYWREYLFNGTHFRKQ